MGDHPWVRIPPPPPLPAERRALASSHPADPPCRGRGETTCPRRELHRLYTARRQNRLFPGRSAKAPQESRDLKPLVERPCMNTGARGAAAGHVSPTATGASGAVRGTCSSIATEPG